jgi:uncharacterized protein YdcH (DUF465 family)
MQLHSAEDLIADLQREVAALGNRIVELDESVDFRITKLETNSKNLNWAEAFSLFVIVCGVCFIFWRLLG